MRTNTNIPPWLSKNMTIAELLDEYGFLPFDTISFQFGMPLIGATGSLFAFVSIWIFFQKKFNDPLYDYFKVIACINLVHLLAYIPHGFCFTPRYLPEINSNACMLFQVVYIAVSNFFFHYTGVVEFAIVLDRLKNFSVFVKQHYTYSPRKMCLILLVTCVVINGFLAFAYKPMNAGVYFYSDQTLGLRKNELYIIVPTDLAKSTIGFLVILVIYIIRDIFTLIIGLVLDMILLLKVKRHLKHRSSRFNFKPSATANLPLRSNTSPRSPNDVIMENVSNSKLQTRLSKQSERNMSLMVFSLCLISGVSRVTMVVCNVFFLVRSDFLALIMATISDLVIIIGAFFSFFVFYNFNKVFRKVCKAVIRPKCFTNNT